MENDSWKTQLRACHPTLRTEVIVANILPTLHSLLTPVEYSRVQSQKDDNIGGVDNLVYILLTKDETTFDRFCSILEDPQNGCSHVARKLRTGNSSICIRECSSTFYVGMAQGVSFSLYIGKVKWANSMKTYFVVA